MLFSLDYCMYHCYILPQPCSSRACSRDDPEDGARRGVPRRRLVTVGLGRHGTPPARHYDLAARSSLDGSGANAGEGSAGPEPKIATVERREACVPRTRDARRLTSAWRAPLSTATGCRPKHPVRLLVLRPPLIRVSEAKKSKPGRKNAPRERRSVV